MTNLTLIIEKNNDEYWGQIQEYPDVFSHGSNLTDLMNNAQVALNLYLDTIGETSIDNPQFQLVVDLQEFLYNPAMLTPLFRFVLTPPFRSIDPLIGDTM